MAYHGAILSVAAVQLGLCHREHGVGGFWRIEMSAKR
jgi:hypothetical protein